MCKKYIFRYKEKSELGLIDSLFQAYDGSECEIIESPLNNEHLTCVRFDNGVESLVNRFELEEVITDIGKFIIAVKCKYHFKEEFELMYAAYDSHSGSYSTGIPCWTTVFAHTILFQSAADAEKWFNKYKKYMIDRNIKVDMETLSIRKIVFEEVQKIEIKEGEKE